jgi:hypothetical protein
MSKKIYLIENIKKIINWNLKILKLYNSKQYCDICYYKSFIYIWNFLNEGSFIIKLIKNNKLYYK